MPEPHSRADAAPLKSLPLWRGIRGYKRKESKCFLLRRCIWSYRVPFSRKGKKLLCSTWICFKDCGWQMHCSENYSCQVFFIYYTYINIQCKWVLLGWVFELLPWSSVMELRKDIWNFSSTSAVHHSLEQEMCCSQSCPAGTCFWSSCWDELHKWLRVAYLTSVCRLTTSSSGSGSTTGRGIHRNLQPTQGVIRAPSLFLKEREAGVSVGALLAGQGWVFSKWEKITTNSESPLASSFQLSLEWLFMNNVEPKIINLMSLAEEIFWLSIFSMFYAFLQPRKPLGT